MFCNYYLRSPPNCTLACQHQHTPLRKIKPALIKGYLLVERPFLPSQCGSPLLRPFIPTLGLPPHYALAITVHCFRSGWRAEQSGRNAYEHRLILHPNHSRHPPVGLPSYKGKRVQISSCPRVEKIVRSWYSFTCLHISILVVFLSCFGFFMVTLFVAEI